MLTESFQVIFCFLQEGTLPPYLMLQMDNCYRECKNKFIMAFAAYLVERKIFKEVGKLKTALSALCLAYHKFARSGISRHASGCVIPCAIFI